MIVKLDHVLTNRQKWSNALFSTLTLEAVVGVDVAKRAVVADTAVTHEAASRVLAVRAILARRRQRALVHIYVTVTSAPAVAAVARVVGVVCGRCARGAAMTAVRRARVQLVLAVLACEQCARQ